jgi:hypothetical protein
MSRCDSGARRAFATDRASLACVQAGWVVRVDWITEDVNPAQRRYQLTVALTPVEPPGGTILWGRSHPPEESYLDQIFSSE